MSNNIDDVETAKDEISKSIDIDGLDVESNEKDTQNTKDNDENKKPYDTRKIDIISTTKTVEQICRRVEFGEIDLSPDFQREKVWNLEQKSKLIESLLLKIPLPTFYVYVQVIDEKDLEDYDIDNDRWVVIDGLQRLSTLNSFYQNEFKLSGLEYLKEFNGMEFKDFKPTKDNIKYRQQYRALTETELLIYVVKPGTPKELAFDIFGRINTLGSPLSNQELRHALNLGRATDFLKKLSKNQNFINAVTKKSLDRMSRMADMELILRLIAFKVLGREKYDRSIAKYLTECMEVLNEKIKVNEDFVYKYKDIEQLEAFFDRAMQKSAIVFGDFAFRKIKKDDKSRRPINKPLFETIGYYIDDYSVEILESKKEQLLEAFTNAMTDDEEYFYSLSYSTNTNKVVDTRFNKTKEIFEKVINNE